MSNSETVTHQFIDEDIINCDLGTYFAYLDGFDRVQTDNYGVFLEMTEDNDNLLFLSKEDLLHLIKLIEETN